MPLQLLSHSLFRAQARDGIFHIVYRTTGREPLATTAKDRRALNEIAIETLDRYCVKLHAYCLMTNHLRALIEIDERVLIEVLRKVALRYARHKQLRAAGRLFERPYAAQRIDNDSAFLELLRSIHLNPVIANKVISPEEYPWSSHRAYLGYRSNALVTTDRAFALFDADRARARVAYHQFIADGVALNVRPSRPDPKRAEHAAMLARLLPMPTDPSDPDAAADTHIELSSVARPCLDTAKPEALSPGQFLSIY